ncbi:MAG: hypothetical protein RL208_26 [Pseudomonadota bacterium]|jgi:hypothetical protein
MFHWLLFLFVVFLNGNVFADAWLQKKGRGVAIPYFGIANMSQTDSKTGGITDNYITQYQYGFYSEYGLHEKVTVGGKFFLMQNVLVDSNYFFSRSIDANFGLDFAEFFTRGELFSTERAVISLVALVKTPNVYTSSLMNEFDKMNDAYELRLEFGYNFGSANKNLQIYNATGDFINLSFANRINRGYDFNENRFEFLYGCFLAQSFLLMLRFQKFVYLYDKEIIFASGRGVNFEKMLFVNNAGFSKWTISLASRVAKHTTLEWGFYQSLNDNFINTSAKNIHLYGFFASLWLDF